MHVIFHSMMVLRSDGGSISKVGGGAKSNDQISFAY